MKKFSRFLISGILLLTLCLISDAQENKSATIPQKIIEFEKSQSEAMNNLEYLTDVIGPRLTGSAQLTRASEWAAQKFKEYGLSDIQQEAWTLKNPWQRGKATVQMVEPRAHNLTVVCSGWSPNTAGLLAGNVVLVDVQSEEDLIKYQGKLKGRIVLDGAPKNFTEGTGGVPPRLRGLINALYVSEQVGLIIRDSAKPHGLLNVGFLNRGTNDGKIEVIPIPAVYTTNEDYSLMCRLLNRGLNVALEANVTNQVSDRPTQIFNTVAEIKGTERPDEVIILCGHLDSWDIGSGATDNGFGAIAVMEAARALVNIGVKPKRTIRFILFTGEEQTLAGSTEYVKAHIKEMGKISAVLVLDGGRGRINGIFMQGNEPAEPILRQVFAPTKELGVTQFDKSITGGTDHVPFILKANVPAFNLSQEAAEYNLTHHSQSDTFDKAVKEDLIQAGTVLAIAAYNIAELPALLPRKGSD